MCATSLRRGGAAVMASALLAAACGGSGLKDLSGTGTSTTTTSDTPSTLDWQSCGEIECASLEVPLDSARPGGRTIALALARRRADGQDVVGSLLLNPGGPGASGKPYVEAAEEVLPAEVLTRFDVVSWDTRGVGESAPVDCLDDLDPFVAVDRTPDDEAELAELVQQSERLAQACDDRDGDVLPFLSTTHTVRDMDRIRAALGEESLTYIGFSYGTYLGARYAEAYPQRVRAMVLDGALDPTLTVEEVTRHQALGLEANLEAFFSWCDETADECGFGTRTGAGDTATAFDALIERVERDGITAGSRVLGPGEADYSVAWALYAGESGWPTLGEALAAADDGDATDLLAIGDDYTGRADDGTYDNSTEAFYATGCVDAPSPSLAEWEEIARRLDGEAPHFGTSTTWLGLPCTYWPAPADAEPRAILAPGAPPILVLGTTGDPVTPIAWARALASQLESGRLLVLDAHGHTAAGRGEPCVDDAVADYLVSLRVPALGTQC